MPSRIERYAIDKSNPFNVIYFVNKDERSINQHDYANGVRIVRKAY